MYLNLKNQNAEDAELFILFSERRTAVGIPMKCWKTTCIWTTQMVLGRNSVSSEGIETRALFESVSVRLTYCQDNLPVLTLALLKQQDT